MMRWNRNEHLLYDEFYFLDGREFFKEHRGLVLSERLHKPFVLAAVGPDDTVLDLGFGRGELALQCALKGAKVIGYDFSRAAHAIAHSVMRQAPHSSQLRVKLRRVDFTAHSVSLPRATVVFMIDVLEHIPREVGLLLLQRVAESLATGGKMVIGTRFGDRSVSHDTLDLTQDELKYLSSRGHHAIYSLEDVRQTMPAEMSLQHFPPDVLVVTKPSGCNQKRTEGK